MKLYEKIRLARIRAGLTQEQLAQKIGVTRSAVAQWEYDNQTYPTKENLEKLSFELGADLSYDDDEPRTDRRYASLGNEKYVPLDERIPANRMKMEGDQIERNIGQQVDGVIRYLILEKNKELFTEFKRSSVVDFETENLVCEVKTSKKALNSVRLLQELTKLANYAEKVKESSTRPELIRTVLINVVRPNGMDSFTFEDIFDKTERFRDIEILTTSDPKSAAEKIIELAKTQD